MSKAELSKLVLCALMLAVLAGCATTSTPVAQGPTDQEQVQSVLAGWKDALMAKDLDKLMALYSENFMSDGRGKADTRTFVGRMFEANFFDKATITVENAQITVDGDRAVARPVTLSGAQGSIDLYLELTKEDGKWLITGSGEA